jgi:hypothetical protein
MYFVRLLNRVKCKMKIMFSVRGFATRSGFDFRKLIFNSGRAGALPSCTNVCKFQKTDFLWGTSGSTSSVIWHQCQRASVPECTSTIIQINQYKYGNTTGMKKTRPHILSWIDAKYEANHNHNSSTIPLAAIKRQNLRSRQWTTMMLNVLSDAS